MRGLRLGLGLGPVRGGSGGTPTPSASYPLFGMNFSLDKGLYSNLIPTWSGVQGEMTNSGWTDDIDYYTPAYLDDAPPSFPVGFTQYLASVQYPGPVGTAYRCALIMTGGTYTSGLFDLTSWDFGGRFSNIKECPGGVPDARGAVYEFDFTMTGKGVGDTSEDHILMKAAYFTPGSPPTGVVVKVISLTPAGTAAWTGHPPLDSGTYNNTTIDLLKTDGLHVDSTRMMDIMTVQKNSLPVTTSGQYDTWPGVASGVPAARAAWVRYRTGTAGFVVQALYNAPSSAYLVDWAALFPNHASGSLGNNISLTINAPSGSTTSVTVTAASPKGWDIVVSPKSTETDLGILNAINGHATAKLLVLASLPVGGDGSGTAIAFAKTQLHDGVDVRNDGAELLRAIQLANAMGTKNPWFNIPWPASSAYATGFAQLIKDNLNPSLFPCIIENHNEWWNWNQAATPSLAAWGIYNGRLAPGSQLIDFAKKEYEASCARIGPAVKAVLGSDVLFVAGSQNEGVQFTQDIITNIPTAIDAVCVAPYFGTGEISNSYPSSSYPSTDAADAAYFAYMENSIDSESTYVSLHAAVTGPAGKKLYGYEGQQHDISGGWPDNSDSRYIDYARRQNSSLMGRAILRWMSEMERVAGMGSTAILCPYRAYGGISGGSSGAWGFKLTFGTGVDPSEVKAAAWRRARAGDFDSYLIGASAPGGDAFLMTGSRVVGNNAVIQVPGIMRAQSATLKLYRVVSGTPVLVQTWTTGGGGLALQSTTQTINYVNTAGDVGYDLYATIDLVNQSGSASPYGTYQTANFADTWYDQAALWAGLSKGSSDNSRFPAQKGSNLPLAVGTGATIGSAPDNGYDMLAANAYFSATAMASSIDMTKPLFIAFLFNKDNEGGGTHVPARVGYSKFVDFYFDGTTLGSYWTHNGAAITLASPMPTGTHVYWIFFAGGAGSAYYAGYDSTIVTTTTLASLPASNSIEGALCLGAANDSGNYTSDMVQYGAQIVNRSGMTLSDAQALVTVMRAQVS